MADKCLDISSVSSYKGINMNFLSNPGLQGQNQYDTNGEEAIRSIMQRLAVYLRAGKYLVYPVPSMEWTI